MALQGINDSKAPACDGFNAYFLKKGLTHPSRISEYRPIFYCTLLCCTLLNKIFSKVLTNKMQCVMEVLMDKNQSTFVSGRLINDNIIPINELVKGYGRKGVSPICMLKVDTKK
ncbi:hypothetical protein H5410_052340, partial [Solanum commersonii]